MQLILGDEDEEPEDTDENVSAQDLVDFSPLYRCLHIFTVLGEKQTFESYYRKQRQEQSILVLQPSTNMVIFMLLLQIANHVNLK